MRIVSVIIAAYNRCGQLKSVLEGLLEQATDGTFVYEVIVVDNNSKDATRQTVEAYIPRFSARELSGKCVGLRYFFEPTQGKAYALNHGIKEAKGEIMVFTDDDVLVDKNWILETVRCFDRYNCDGVGGRVLPVYPDNTPDWIKREDPNKMSGIVVVYDYGAETKKYEKLMDEFIGANYAFKGEVFDDCGLFRAEFSKSKVPVGEDREFIDRLIKNNKILYYCGEAVIRHPVDVSRARFKNVARWNMALGRSAALREQEQDREFKYLFGVPQYLFCGVVTDFLCIFPSLFSQRELFYRLRSFFRKVGMILEYRSVKSRKL